MKKDCGQPWGALIERGKVTAEENGAYTVESIDRPGVTAWGLGGGGAAHAAGETVWFFVFPDGKGMIIGTAE